MLWAHPIQLFSDEVPSFRRREHLKEWMSSSEHGPKRMEMDGDSTGGACSRKSFVSFIQTLTCTGQYDIQHGRVWQMLGCNLPDPSQLVRSKASIKTRLVVRTLEAYASRAWNRQFH